MTPNDPSQKFREKAKAIFLIVSKYTPLPSQIEDIERILQQIDQAAREEERLNCLEIAEKACNGCYHEMIESDDKCGAKSWWEGKLQTAQGICNKIRERGTK